MKAWMIFLFTFSTVAAARDISIDSFYEDNPTYRDRVNDDSTWAFAPPANVGLDATLLEKAAREIGANKYSYSLLVIRHGTLAFERYFHGSGKTSSNNIHSASKSILSAAVGVAVEKGLMRVDQPLAELLPGAPRGVNVRHLLTMSAGIKWEEDKTEYEIERERNWVQAILRLPFPNPPGRDFLYSTGLTHLLSAALGKATKTNAAAFIRANIFGPIGIADEHWGKDPQGVSSGGYNLYLTPREMAKFGMLYLQGGKWKGKQVVPSAWVQASQSAQILARPGFYYGFNWWLRDYNGTQVAFAWGYGGQFIYVVPSLDLVVVTTTNTKGKDPLFEAEQVMKKYILPAVKR